MSRVEPHNAKRLFELGVVVVVIASTATTASASTVTVFGLAFTHNCCGDDGWSETKSGGGSPSFGTDSVHATMGAAVQGGVTLPGSWHVFASAEAKATDVLRGAYADGLIDVDIRDQVTPVVPPYIDGGLLEYTQHFHIEGTTTASGTAPGAGEAVVSYRVLVDNSQVAFGEESLFSDTGYISTMPRGDVPWTARVAPNVPFELRIQIGAYAAGYGIEEAGMGRGKSDFKNTFVWGEVTDVVHLTTGQPIPAEDFHLYGEDGFDWAHPPGIVPEPAALSLLGLAGFLLLLRRASTRLKAK
jgi:hypothetical protein